MSYTLDNLKAARDAFLQGDQLKGMAILNLLIEKMQRIWDTRNKPFKSEIQQESIYDHHNKTSGATPKAFRQQ